MVDDKGIKEIADILVDSYWVSSRRHVGIDVYNMELGNIVNRRGITLDNEDKKLIATMVKSFVDQIPKVRDKCTLTFDEFWSIHVPGVNNDTK